MSNYNEFSYLLLLLCVVSMSNELSDLLYDWCMSFIFAVFNAFCGSFCCQYVD